MTSQAQEVGEEVTKAAVYGFMHLTEHPQIQPAHGVVNEESLVPDISTLSNFVSNSQVPQKEGFCLVTFQTSHKCILLVEPKLYSDGKHPLAFKHLPKEEEYLREFKECTTVYFWIFLYKWSRKSNSNLFELVVFILGHDSISAKNLGYPKGLVAVDVVDVTIK